MVEWSEQRWRWRRRCRCRRRFTITMHCIALLEPFYDHNGSRAAVECCKVQQPTAYSWQMDFMPIVRNDSLSRGATTLQSQHAVLWLLTICSLVLSQSSKTGLFSHHRMVTIRNMDHLICFWSKGSNYANLMLYKSSLSLVPLLHERNHFDRDRFHI